MARLTREQRRDQLVALGVDAVADSSFDEVSIDDVAERAGIARSLLFHYFPTKSRFFVAIAEWAAAELLVATEPDPDLPIEQRLHESLDAYVRYVSRRRTAYLSAVRGAAGGDAAMQAVFERTRREVADRFLTALATDPGRASASLRIAARGAVGFIEEATVAWLDEGGADHDEFVALMQRSLEGALRIPTDEPA